MKCLILDDEPDVAENLAKYLEHAYGLEAYPTTTLENAVVLAEQHIFDTAIIDKGVRGGALGHRGGLEFVRWLSEYSPPTRITVFSGESGINDEIRKSGANAFACKTCDLDDLASYAGKGFTSEEERKQGCILVGQTSSWFERRRR